MKLLIWEAFDVRSYFLDLLRKDIQDLQKIVPIGRFRSGMTSSKLLKNNIIHLKGTLMQIRKSLHMFVFI